MFPNDSNRKWHLYALIALVIITICLAGGGAIIFYRAKTIYRQALRQTNQTRAEAKRKAEEIEEKAQREAEEIIAQARRKVNRSREKIIKDLEGLQEYSPSDQGWVSINEKYFKKFCIKGDKVHFVFKNTSDYGKVKPDCKVIFYDSAGVTTGWSSVTTLFIGLEAGQTRKEEEIIAGKISEKPTSFYKVKIK